MNIHDGGEYSCEIEADLPEPISVVHTVEILGKEFHMEYRVTHHIGTNLLLTPKERLRFSTWATY